MKIVVALPQPGGTAGRNEDAKRNCQAVIRSKRPEIEMRPALLRALIAGIPLCVNACSIRPLPQDYSGVDTYDIVRQVRCEMRSAIQAALIDWLNRPRINGRPDRNGTTELVFTELAKKFSIDPKVRINFDINDFPGNANVIEDARGIIAKFQNTGVALDFSFDMTELNSLDASLGLLGILRHTLGTIGLSAELSQSRQNVRTFTIADTFKGLLSINRPEDYCINYVSVGRVQYPITGRIGLKEVVQNFIVNALFSNLNGADHQGPPSIGEIITFTTKISGSVAPKFEFGSAYRGFQAGSVGFNSSASRIDSHKLIIGLALPPDAEPEDQKKPTERRSSERDLLIGSLIRLRGTAAQVDALREVNQVIFRFELGRPGGTFLPIQ